MGSRRSHLALVATLAAATVCTSSAGAALRVLMSRTPNKTDSNRTAKTISGIVIHDTEGRFIGSIRALQNPRVDGSAHFVVSRSGQVVQLVPVTDVAWHAGNGWWNLHSIGIEHEGWADRRAYTEREYRASAQLVAYLAHRWGIPVDRDHIIGHAEVPDPYHPGRFGGISHHTDPGRHWNWPHYMALVRHYRADLVMPHFVKRMTLHQLPTPHAPAEPRRPTVDRNATVRGKALWWSGIDAYQRWRRHIWKVDFIVDGKTLYTDHTWPYSFHRTVGWNTRAVTNGSHMLSVLAYGTHHYRLRKRIPVRVANPPIRLRLSGAVAGGAVRDTLSLRVRASQPVTRVTLYADGHPVSRDATPPYRLTWDTAAAAEGAHTLLVYARDARGHRASRELPVVVANAPEFPAALTRNWATHDVVDEGGFGFVTPDR